MEKRMGRHPTLNVQLSFINHKSISIQIEFIERNQVTEVLNGIARATCLS